MNSIVVSFVVSCLLSLINIGSTTAFNALLSVGVVALMATYSISIFCVFLKRLRHESFGYARWKILGNNSAYGDGRSGGLGRYGLWVNALGLAYSLWSFFWGFWPTVKDVQPASMNWAVLIFVAVMLFAGVAYRVHARKVYDGPVTKIIDLDRNGQD